MEVHKIVSDVSANTHEDNLLINSCQSSFMMSIDDTQCSRIGTWNIRTMKFNQNELVHQQKLCKEFRKNNLKILGITEARIPGIDKLQTSTGESLLHSGLPPECKAAAGVCFLLSPSAQRSLLDWHGISERIIVARFRASPKNMTIVLAYAPTLDSKLSKKRDFYTQLDRTIDTEVPPTDIIILMGDFNAQVGSDNNGWEKVMGKHGILKSQMNENGTMFANLCNRYGLVIGGTLFTHDDSYKHTWISPKKPYRTQIDHIAISQQWKSSLNDVRTNIGANIKSDHRLLVAKIHLKLPTPKRLNLRSSNRTRKGTDLRDRFATIETADQTKMVKEEQRQEWMSDATWKLIENQKRLKERIESGDITDEEKLLFASEEVKIKRHARLEKRNFNKIDSSDSNKSITQIRIAPKIKPAFTVNPPTYNEILNSLKLIASNRVAAEYVCTKIKQIWKCEDIAGSLKLGPEINEILEIILYDRLATVMRPSITDDNKTFVACTQSIILRIIIEQSEENLCPVQILFILFDFDVDSIYRNILWEILSSLNVPDKLIIVIKSLYKHSTAFQGFKLSPLLCSLVVDWVLLKTREDSCGIKWFANDRAHLEELVLTTNTLCILANSRENLDKKMQRFIEYAEEVGLRISETKLISVCDVATTPIIMINNRPVEAVNSFSFHDCLIATKMCSKAVQRELVVQSMEKARLAFAKLIMEHSWIDLSVDNKLGEFKRICFSLLLNGCESWKPNAEILKLLQQFINKCLTEINGEKISNEMVRSMIHSRKWKWISITLLANHDHHTIAKEALDWVPEGKRKSGGQIVTWKRAAEREAKNVGLSWQQVKNKADNAKEWMKFINNLMCKKPSVDKVFALMLYEDMRVSNALSCEHL